MESGKPNADFVSEYDDPLRRMELNFRFFTTVGVSDPETMADYLNNANDLPHYLRLLAFDIIFGILSEMKGYSHREILVCLLTKWRKGSVEIYDVGCASPLIGRINSLT